MLKERGRKKMVEPATTFAQTKKGRERPLFLSVDFHKKRAKSRALISSANMLIWCDKIDL